jgi:prolyl-tRNA synthetase
LVALNASDEKVAAASESLYQQLWEEGIETLYDDRTDQAAGVKLNDADLIGLPVRLVVSPRNLGNGVVEIKERREAESAMVPVDQVVAFIKEGQRRS